MKYTYVKRLGAVALTVALVLGVAANGHTQGMSTLGGSRVGASEGHHESDGHHEGNSSRGHDHDMDRHHGDVRFHHGVRYWYPYYYSFYYPYYAAPTYWYCPSFGAYYPAVVTCPDAWVPVSG